MREWMKLLESLDRDKKEESIDLPIIKEVVSYDILNEKMYDVTIRKNRSYNKEVTILENPSVHQILKFLKQSKYSELKGLVSIDTLYFWDGYEANHDEIRNPIGLAQEGESENIYISNPYGKILFRGYKNAELAYPYSGIKKLYDSLTKINPIEIDDIVVESIIYVEMMTTYSTEPKKIKILENPSPREVHAQQYFAKAYTIRGIITESGSLFTWDAYEANHDMMISELGLDEERWTPIFISKNPYYKDEPNIDRKSVV